MTLSEALSIRSREVVSLTGAGGKTTLMFALGRELSIPGRGVLLTTTTKIWDPEPADEFALFLSPDPEELKEWVGRNLSRRRYLLVAAEKLGSGKLQGVPPGWISGLFSVPGVSHMVIEADGAAGRPLKAPREGEPVIPAETTLLIPVVGIDALGKALGEDYVFRSRIAAEILDQPEGSILTEKMIAKLVAASLRNIPKNARVVPFLNKADLPNGVAKGRSLARVLRETLSPRVDKVVLGRAQGPRFVVEVIPA